jgi:hypothetical protein
MATSVPALTRRSFVGALPGVAVLPLAGTAAAARQAPAAPAIHEEFPAQDPALVREMVGVSHGNLARVQELLERSPALAKASWDWGFGDWESALGAAAHTGNRDIALLLIGKGARPDLFSAAMLGQLEIVRAFVESSSGTTPVQRIAGPHSITLLSHARAGGEPARAVAEYLVALGDADLGPSDEALSDQEKQAYLGEYAFGPGPRDRLRVLEMRGGWLGLEREGGAPRRLFRAGGHAFHPAGAPAVRVTFTVLEARVASLTVHDPHPIVVATRIA